jgi:hypothetical protein
MVSHPSAYAELDQLQLVAEQFLRPFRKTLKIPFRISQPHQRPQYWPFKAIPVSTLRVYSKSTITSIFSKVPVWVRVYTFATEAEILEKLPELLSNRFLYGQVAWTQHSVHYEDQATGRGQFELLLPDHAAACQQQAVGRLVSHRKHVGLSDPQVAGQAQRSLSALCRQRLVGRLQLLKRHVGQPGGRSRRKRPRAENSSHTRQEPALADELGRASVLMEEDPWGI